MQDLEQTHEAAASDTADEQPKIAPELEADSSAPESEVSEEDPEQASAGTESMGDEQSEVSGEVADLLVAEAVSEGIEGESRRDILKAVIEAAIYITDEPLTADQIATALEQPATVVKEILGAIGS